MMPSSALTRAAAFFTRAIATMCAGSRVVPLIGKFSTARWVWARQRASVGTSMSPMLSCSVRVCGVCRRDSWPRRYLRRLTVSAATGRAGTAPSRSWSSTSYRCSVQLPNTCSIVAASSGAGVADQTTSAPPGLMIRCVLGQEVVLVDRRVARRGRGSRAVVDVEQHQVVGARRPPRRPSRCRRRRGARRLSASSAGPCGMVPSRIQPTSASSISTTFTCSTRGSASTRWVVKPSPSPPTTTPRGSSTSPSAAAASSISVWSRWVSITKTPLTRSSRTSAARSSIASAQHELPALGLGARDLDVLGHGGCAPLAGGRGLRHTSWLLGPTDLV